MPAKRRPGRPADYDGIEPVIAEGLEVLGLTAYEIRVYDAVLRHPGSRVPEIARASRVPQPKVYSTIKRLIERGLCESHLGAINTYSAHDPDDAFETLLHESAERQRHAKNAVLELQKAYAAAGDGKSRREGRVKLFQGRPAAGRAFKELMGGAEKHVSIVVRFPLIVADYLESVERILANGGDARLLFEIPEGTHDEQADEFLEACMKTGADVRIAQHVPMRMGVFDSRILVLPMLDPSVEQGDAFQMLEVRNPELCQSFLEIFGMLFEGAGAA